MMDPRLTTLPDPVLEERLDGLIDPWCSMPVDLCRCRPRPLPQPAPSAGVRTLQRAMRAERESEPLEMPAGPLTHGTPEQAPEGPLSPMTPLSPHYYYRKAGAA